MSFASWLQSRIDEESVLAENENAFSGKHRLTLNTLQEVQRQYDLSHKTIEEILPVDSAHEAWVDKLLAKPITKRPLKRKVEEDDSYQKLAQFLIKGDTE